MLIIANYHIINIYNTIQHSKIPELLKEEYLIQKVMREFHLLQFRSGEQQQEQ